MRVNEIERAASEEARRLGHHWLGPEHALLAILHGDPEDIACKALLEAGVRATTIEDLLVSEENSRNTELEASRLLIVQNPDWYRTTGRAEGFAAGLGTGRLRAVDLLLAILWDPWHFAGDEPLPREAVMEALTRLGAKLPAVPLPELDPTPVFTEHIEFPTSKLDRVITLLVQRYPPGRGPTYGYNCDGAERAWVDAEDGIDLRSIINAALSEDG